MLLTLFTWAQAYSVDCKGLPCAAPYTQTPLGSPCGCVLPMQVELALNVTLGVLLPEVLVLTGEIAYGLLLHESQVRMVEAIADSQDQSKSIAKIDLVPLGKSFDNLTAIMIFQRLSNHQVLDSDSYFSNYTLMYIHYPGLPSSTSFTYPSNTTAGELPRTGLWPNEQPLSVDVPKGGRRIGGGTIALILLSSAVATAAACGVIVLLLFRSNKLIIAFQTSAKSNCVQKRSGNLSTASSESGNLSSGSFFSSVATYTMAARIFSLYELERSTNNFNSNNVVGQGGSGRVFAGMLEDGTEVAVKILARDDQQKKNEFLAEVEVLSRVHHRNLVKLIGVCTEEQSRCLVYELIRNGSVESHLHGADKLAKPLDWDARMKIALGAARGLAYLHEDANPRVIHRDFKASNILLEKDFTPKISDFGLAKAAPDEEDGNISTSVMGTFGYVAPEYAMAGHLLLKSDVYSYGVVLLELLSGKRPIDLSQPSGKENLVDWARPLLSSEEGLEILADPNLEGRYPFDIFAKVAAVASMCVQPELSYRLFMGEVVQALKIVCSNSEGVSSLSVSPQGSSDAQSDVGGQVSDSRSGPIINTDGASSTSVDFGFGTAPRTSKETPESFSTSLSNSGYLHRHLSDSSERHSLSGPSSSARTSYAWSVERDSVYLPVSEHRVFRYKDKSVKAETCGSWP